MDLGITLVVLVVLLALIWRFLGAYMAAVYEGRVTWLAWAERPIYRVLGVDAEAEQSWKSYAVSLIVFSGVAILITYGIIRLQGHLPLNPAHQGAVSQGVSWNTAVSFVTNTNWQAYSGETTMSYLSQMGALAVQNFLSAAVGIAVAVALIRGFARRGSGTIGNFWVDLVRGTLYILLPVSILITLVFMGEGAIQTMGGPVSIHDHLSGFKQTLPRGPFASQEVIKELGTNGGGTYNANGAITLENPTGVTNFLSILLILSIPVSLTYTFGKMVGRVREGVAVLAAMTVIFGACFALTAVAEAQPSRAVTAAGLPHQPLGNTEGKEARFGSGSSALYDITSTQTSTGSVDSTPDSYTPLGGLGPMAGMMFGEVSPGGVGSGLYTILLSAIITVFIGGLMIGRTPEYLGKKIQAKEVKLAGLGVLIMPITVLVLAGIAVSVHDGTSVTNNNGPHGFSEILYAFTSMANNNGSAFAGLTVTNAFWTILGGVAMLIGRFGIIIPVLALAGTLAAKQKVATSIGTFRTDSTLFTALLIGVIVIIGGLTFFPAVALGPLADQLSHGRLF